MSLFQAREWWRYRPDGAEECDTGCMAVVNIDNNRDKRVKIVTGNFQGVLRIFLPQVTGDLSESQAPRNIQYTESHMLLETNLGEPILQLSTGLFSSSVPYNCLAVLHPRRLVVYQVSSQSSGADGSNVDSLIDKRLNQSLSLTKLYEHAIPRSAYNMCNGLFSTVNSINDCICVQSLDGEMYFFEQDHLLFTRYLPDFVAPGPLCYVSSTQSLLTVNSNMYLQAYSFQQLSLQTLTTNVDDAETGDNAITATTIVEHPDENTTTITKSSSKSRDDRVRKVKPLWSVNLGDYATSIFTARLSKPVNNRSSSSSSGSNGYPLEVVVLCERTLFVFSVDGTLRFTRRLDYDPSYGCAYTVSRSMAQHKSKPMNMENNANMQQRRGSNANAMSLSEFLNDEEINQRNIDVDVYALQHIMIGTHQRSVMIYKDTNLLWSARNPNNNNNNNSNTSSNGDLDDQPTLVQSCVAQIGGVQGLIVQLFDNNSVVVSYLGTDPPPMNAQRAITGRDQEYESMEAEHKALMKKIRQLGSESSSSNSGVLSITSKVYTVDNTMKSPTPTTTTASTCGANAGALSFVRRTDCVKSAPTYSNPSEYRYCSVDIALKWSGSESMSNLMLSLSHHAAYICDVSTFSLPTFPVNTDNTNNKDNYDNTTPLILTVKFRCSTQSLPSSTAVTLTASFMTHTNEPRSQTSTFNLPLDLAVSVCPPIKSSNYILTLELNRPSVPPLNLLFPDLFALGLLQFPDIQRTAANILSVQYANQQDYATILVSKKGSRYRLQTSSMASCSLILNELIDRLVLHHKFNDTIPTTGSSESGEFDGKFKISIHETPDVESWFTFVKQHFVLKKSLIDLNTKAEALSQQYHALERRMLVKYRDKTPQSDLKSGLKGMDVVLKSTHSKLVALMFNIEQQQTSLQQARCGLGGANETLLLMLKHHFALDARNFELLKAYMGQISSDESCRCCVGVSTHLKIDKRSNQANYVHACNDSNKTFFVATFPASPPPPLVEVTQGETHDFTWEESLFASTSYLLRTSLCKDGDSCGYTVQQYPKLESLDSPDVLLSNLQEIIAQFNKGSRLYVKKDGK